MSQPAMSQAIARLERPLGVRLFERTSREVQLTDAGRGAARRTRRRCWTRPPRSPPRRPGWPRPPTDHSPCLSPARRRARRPGRPPARRPQAGDRGRAARPPGWAAATAALAERRGVRGDPEPRRSRQGSPPPPGSTCRSTTSPCRPATRWPPLPRIRPDAARAARAAAAAHRPPGGAWARLAAGPAPRGWPTTTTTSPPRWTWSPPARGCCPSRTCSSRRSAGRTSVRPARRGRPAHHLRAGLAGREPSAELMALVQAVQEALWTR